MCVPVVNEVEEQYTVHVPHTRTETREYQVRVPVQREVEQKYTVCVPHTEQVERFKAKAQQLAES